ncbi:MAG: hypothetical protein WCO13_12570 [Bacteroidota bacterium]
MRNIIFTLLIIMGSIGLFAQPIPPGGGVAGAHGLSGNQGGFGAPIDGGFSILILLGAIYGAKNINKINKKDDMIKI